MTRKSAIRLYTQRSKPFKVLTISLFIATCLFLIATNFGCAGGQGRYTGEYKDKTMIEVTRDPDGTTHTTVTNDGEQHADATAHVQAPDNANHDSTLTINRNGVTAGAGSEWQPQAVDWVKKNGSMICYITCAIFIAAGLAMIFVPALALLKLKPLGIALVIAGGFVAALPSVIDKLTIPLSIAVFVAIIGAGLIWLWAHRRGISATVNDFKQRADAAAARLVNEGRPAEATAARRAADPDYDKTFVAKKMEVTAEGKIPPNLPPDGPIDLTIPPAIGS